MIGSVQVNKRNASWMMCCLLFQGLVGKEQDEGEMDGGGCPKNLRGKGEKWVTGAE